MMHEGILMFLPPTFVADIDNLGFLNIVRETPFDAAMSIFADKRLRYLD